VLKITQKSSKVGINGFVLGYNRLYEFIIELILASIM